MRNDRAFLEQSIGDEGIGTLGEVVRMAAADLDPPDFVVVFGSRARDARRNDADIDVIFEAPWVPADPGRMPRLRERQDQLIFDLMAFPRGLLLGRLRVRDEVARTIMREGRVYADPDGWFRNVLIVVEEEALI